MFKLKLNNYRGFLNQEFDFSRVNILIGENSAGKSSVLKFLLALKQSLRSPNNRDYNLTLRGEYVDLGNYYETIYNHKVDSNLSFSFEFGKEYFGFFVKDTFPNFVEDDDEKNKILEKKNQVISYLADADKNSTILTFQVSNDLSNHKNIVFSASNDSIGTVKIVFPQSENSAEQDIYILGDNPKCEVVFESTYYKQTFNIKDVEYEKRGFLTMVDGETLKDGIQKHSGLDNSESRLYWHIGFLLIAQNYIEMLLRQIKYVNPVRYGQDVAQRGYFDDDKKNVMEIRNIKDLINFMDTSTTKKDFETDLMNIVKNFGIADSFTIKKESFTKEFRIKLDNLESNIKDVGFGVSLQLPIFAQAIISETTVVKKNNRNEIFEGETLLIEQPEVHLHPRLQAKFIETLLSIGNNNVYFIETHSEHIIRMLQVMVKTKKIASDDISIHYFKKEGTEMQKSEHKINSETGKLRPNFPKGFYDVSYDLAFQLMD